MPSAANMPTKAEVRVLPADAVGDGVSLLLQAKQNKIVQTIEILLVMRVIFFVMTVSNFKRFNQDNFF